MASDYAEFEMFCADLALHLDAIEYEAWLDANALESFI